MVRKRRTRQHVIADLATNHVERHVLRRGHTVLRVAQDYGYDLILSTYGDTGEIENGQILLQIKATDRLRILADGRTISCVVERRDLDLWLDEPSPVILIVYDAQRDVAYWLYIQAYLEGQADFDLAGVGATVTVRIPLSNRLDEEAVEQFAGFRDDVLRLAREVVRHHV